MDSQRRFKRCFLLLLVSLGNIRRCSGGLETSRVCGYIGGNKRRLQDDFLRDAAYSIQSARDKGFLTVRDSPASVYKIIQPEPWTNDIAQKWMVFDYQSIGRYDFTPVIFNTTDNIVTFEPTKNIYSYKRQWTVHLVTTDKYQIKNPESTLCLTNLGPYKEVTEQTCQARLPLYQLWKFRIVKV